MGHTNHTGAGNRALRAAAMLLAVLFLFAGCSGSSGGGGQQDAVDGELLLADAPEVPEEGEAEAEPLPEPEPEPEPVVEEHRVRFSAVGDNLIHSSIYEQAAARAGGEGYDFAYVYENLAYFFEGFDVNWINQESLVSELPASTYPMFSTPAELGRAAYDAGWRVFALSNNHTYDKFSTGIQATMDFWATMPGDVYTPGLFQNPEGDGDIVLQQVNGVTIAYLSFTEHTNGLETPADAPARVIYTSETELMQRLVQRAAELADFVVVGLHWGTEDSHTVNDNQRHLGIQLAAWGCDVLIGTHPHVVQPVEWVEKPEGGRMLLAYSLGNFLSAQSYPDQLIGIALTFEIVMETTDGVVSAGPWVENVQVYPTVTHYDTTYTNVRSYMYRDYTDELAAKHGVQARGTFSHAYIEGVAQTYIDEEFLVLD